MDFRHPYLSTQLIAYIGNKRALLPFLHEVFSQLQPQGAGDTIFLDPFAGSGAVSRLARMMGFAVFANDWEPYARVINTCHLCASSADLERPFSLHGGLDAVIRQLNDLPTLPQEKWYVARHYAPRRTESADWRTERLFYTTENALRIDSMRWRIEELYPGEPADPDERLEKTLLLGPLLYECATHTNTSGVFKACHRGFGGHGKDALGRIMGAIRMSAPVLIDSPAPAAVACEDALRFLSGRSADICYLDPPYAVHQYGSNYFMLNSIALWDRPPVSDERQADGRLRQKAGIRRDWTTTRSAFCYRSTAAAALRDVVRAADCRHLVVSYSNEGLIGLEELCDILSETGRLSIRSTGYQKYPGGKQSLRRTTRNLELALIVERGTSHGAARTPTPAPATARVRDLLRDLNVARLMGGTYIPSRIHSAFPCSADGITVPLSNRGSLSLRMNHHWKFVPEAEAPHFDAPEDAERFTALLAGCQAHDVPEQIDAVTEILRSGVSVQEEEKLLREMLRLFNKLAHRKYSAEFRETLGKLEALAVEMQLEESFRAGLDRVVTTSARRQGTVGA